MEKAGELLAQNTVQPREALEHAVTSEAERQSALERAGGDPDFLNQLIELFLNEAPLLMENMREALQTGDTARLRAAAHTLKGSALTVGARESGAAALRLEQLTGQAELANAARVLAELEQALQHDAGEFRRME